jgi:excisionase family DNA binding protein
MNAAKAAAQGAVLEPGPVRRLLSAHDVAAMLGVKESWVYAQARAKRIPHMRLGRYTRFNADSIAAWAAEQEQGPVPTRWATWALASAGARID